MALASSLVLGSALILAPAVARAGVVEVEAGPWIGVLALDPHLADYRWETSTRTVWGLSTGASTGRLGGGARIWRASTRQSTGIPGDARTLSVSLTGVEAVGEARLFSLAGARFLATASCGVLRLDWSPRELDLGDALGTGPETVVFEPLSEATGGVGVAMRRSVAFGFQAAAAVERTWFGLDTAHRRGDGIVEEREVFGSWTGRVEITRRLFGL
jgi:hypothetical protein